MDMNISLGIGQVTPEVLVVLLLAGGPPSMTFVYIILTEGAPSLRSVQGWVAMLPAQLLFFRTKSVAHAFVVPALCKLRKRTGHLGPLSASSQKPGHPANIQCDPVLGRCSPERTCFGD
jgi:hypothetical protein